jgi:galacturan 1,4-alpha-galacturonidase
MGKIDGFNRNAIHINSTNEINANAVQVDPLSTGNFDIYKLSSPRLDELHQHRHHPQFLLVMYISNLFSAAALCALATSVAGNPKPHNDLPKRPAIVAAPYGTGKGFPHSHPRSSKHFCYVKPTKGKKRDDSPRILNAFKKCNKGGTIVLDKNYTIASPLDLTWLSHVDVVITGEIHFKSDPYYWAENSFKYDFQNMSSFWKIGGKDVNIYGDLSNDQSVLDGHGQDYWKEYVTNKTVSVNLM